MCKDEDSANKNIGRRSESGVALLVGGTIVNASCTTRYYITLSSSEAEYVAMIQEAKTVLFTICLIFCSQSLMRLSTSSERIRVDRDGRNPTIGRVGADKTD